MVSDTEDGMLIRYFQRQQLQSGWLSLLSLMVEGMINNVGEQECRPFLQQMGADLAERYPLDVAQTLDA